MSFDLHKGSVIRQQLDERVFGDSYCVSCRCGPMHHTIEAEKALEASGIDIRVYCKHHKKLCYRQVLDGEAGVR